MMSPNTSLRILWTAWLLGWLAAAPWAAKTVIRQSAASRLANAILLLAGGFLLFIRPSGSGGLLRSQFVTSVWSEWGGVVAVAAGLGFAGWARVHLGRFWSGTVTLKADHALIRTGPYGLVRHPIYTGLLLAAAGTALARHTVGGVLGLGLLVLGIVVKLRQEERLLSEHFGDAYRSYQKEVPALIPRFK